MKNKEKNVDKVLSKISELNSKEAYKESTEMEFLEPFMRTIQSIIGHDRGRKEYTLYYKESNEIRKNKERWEFGKNSHVFKDLEISKRIVEGRWCDSMLETISDLYLRKYLPHVSYKELFTVSDYSNKRAYNHTSNGFLRGENIERSALKYNTAKSERNHYRTIEDPECGLQFSDLSDIVEYLSEYNEVSDAMIVAVVNKISMFKISSVLSAPKQTEMFYRTGQEAIVIGGVYFILNELIPDNWALFLDGAADHIITKLESPQERRKGLSWRSDNLFSEVKDFKDLDGSKLVSDGVGYHLTGRHSGCFLYMGSKKVSTSDGRKTHPLTDTPESEDIIKELSKHEEKLIMSLKEFVE